MAAGKVMASQVAEMLGAVGGNLVSAAPREDRRCRWCGRACGGRTDFGKRALVRPGAAGRRGHPAPCRACAERGATRAGRPGLGADRVAREAPGRGARAGDVPGRGPRASRSPAGARRDRRVRHGRDADAVLRNGFGRPIRHGAQRPGGRACPRRDRFRHRSGAGIDAACRRDGADGRLRGRLGDFRGAPEPERYGRSPGALRRDGFLQGKPPAPRPSRVATRVRPEKSYQDKPRPACPAIRCRIPGFVRVGETRGRSVAAVRGVEAQKRIDGAAAASRATSRARTVDGMGAQVVASSIRPPAKRTPQRQPKTGRKSHDQGRAGRLDEAGASRRRRTVRKVQESLSR